jgi:hypothetical protein
VAAGAPRNVTVAGVGGVAVGATDVLAVVVALPTTAAGGAFSIWDTGGTAPATPAMRWTADTTTYVQFVVAHLSVDGRVTVDNLSGSATHVLIDVYGYFT